MFFKVRKKTKQNKTNKKNKKQKTKNKQKKKQALGDRDAPPSSRGPFVI